MKIGIIGAMSVEVEELVSKLEGTKMQKISEIDFFEGTLYGKNVVIAKCGIGKVFAAVCAEAMLLRYSVTHIINTGVAGTLTPELGILDIAIADGVVQHDMDTSPIGDPIGLISGINKIVLPTSRSLAAAATSAAQKLGFSAKCGIVASGDQFISSKERKKFIRNTFSAICCEMEGAAIGHVCYINGVECLIVRAISDSASGEAELEYPQMVALAAQRSQKLIEEILTGGAL